MSTFTAHERWMHRALNLAAKGKGRVEPNPPVGAVIVREGKLIGEGFHQQFGGPHAEVHAMRNVAGCAGATLYTTLAPCTGTGKKTPPCCDAVLAAGFRQIVIGTEDPTQDAAAPRLKAAGVHVVTGVLQDECERMIAPFLKLKLKKRPWVIAKWAMTADGKIATASGDSKWVSCENSRETVHHWRNEVDAVLVGAGTVRHDDPELTCRIPGGRNPLRVILDSNASLPLDSRLAQSIDKAPLLVACLESAPEESCRQLADKGCRILRLPGRDGRVDADALLGALGGDALTNVLVEGGSRILADFFDRRLVDEVRIFVAPRIVGGQTAPTPVGGAGIPLMKDSIALKRVKWNPIGDDLLMTADL